MLTLRNLIRATPRPVQVRALMQCRSTITRAILEIDQFGNRRRNIAGLVRATDGDRFCTIMFYDPDMKNLSGSKVWVHCSCPYTTFVTETVLSLHKSSDIINSNGQLPIVRNPRMIPHVCKHLIALAKVAINAKVKDMTPKKTKNEKGKKVPPAKMLDRKPAKPAAPKQYTKKPVKPLAKPQRPTGPAGPKGPVRR